jgi:hypothetical protein
MVWQRHAQGERLLEDEAKDTRRCRHCGAQFNHHRGGTADEPEAVRRKCPPMHRGFPLDFPKVVPCTPEELDRVAARYWSAPTVFEAVTAEGCDCGSCHDHNADEAY